MAVYAGLALYAGPFVVAIHARACCTLNIYSRMVRLLKRVKDTGTFPSSVPAIHFCVGMGCVCWCVYEEWGVAVCMKGVGCECGWNGWGMCGKCKGV